MQVATERTYKLSDLDYWPLCLEDWPYDGLHHWPKDGVPLAVVGSPIAHSLSPVMHNAALAELAKTNKEFAKWRYFKFEIEPAELLGALQEFTKRKFRGLNLTVPNKAIVVSHLNFKDSFVQDAGAANTLTPADTWWKGSNTDGIGLSAAMREDLAAELDGSDVILLGAGGAARAAAVECINHGCASLWIGNRTQTLRDNLILSLKNITQRSRIPIPIRAFSLKYISRVKLPRSAIVINATSVGLKLTDGSPIDLTKIPKPGKVFDMIYRPPQTALLRQAAEMGIEHANGLSMLVHQGAASLELWTREMGINIQAPIEIMRQAAADALK